MSTLLRSNFVEMEGSIQKVLDTIVKRNDDLTKKFFNMGKSTRSQENHLGTGEMGLMTEWDKQVSYDTFVKGHDSQYRHKKYSTGIEIERELLDDKEFGEIKKRTRKKSYAIVKTLNFYASSVFNDGFSSFKSADGLSLFNANHTIVPGADAQSNTGTSSLTVDSLEDTMIAMREFKDDRGHPMMVMPNLIICGEYWRKTAQQLVGSSREPFTADNQTNVYKNNEGLSYFCTPWITGKKWALVDEEMMKDGGSLNWYMRRDPRSFEYDDDFDTEVGKYKAVGRWSFGCDSPFFGYGHNPA